MKEEYKTVLKEANAELVEKRSRFIANVKPVRTEDEALEYLERMPKIKSPTKSAANIQLKTMRRILKFS